MKVVYFAHSLLSRGGDKVILSHLGHLAASGHQVSMQVNEVESIFVSPAGVAVERLPFPSKMGTLLCALSRRQPGSLLLATIIPTAVCLALRNRGRVVYFAQDYNEDFYRSPLLKRLIRLLYYVGLRVLKIQVCAVSQDLAKIFLDRFNVAAAVMENGVDTGRFYPDPDPELVRGKGDRKALLLFFRRDLRKGYDLALQALRALSVRNGSSLTLWTVGERMQPDEMALPTHEFGYVDEQKLRRLMSSADLFLYPSRQEGFGLMPLEAFACRCPVVTTAAVPYAVDEENSLVCPVDDVSALIGAASRILEDKPLAKALSERGFLFAQTCSQHKSNQAFESWLREFAQSSGVLPAG